MKDITLKTPEQLGSAIRLKRIERGMSQVDLADRLGVERKWVMKLEAGNPKAEFGLILKALFELDMEGRLTLSDTSLRAPSHRSSTHQGRTSRLDQVFERLDRRRK
jgi:HTH-type transcriptional regulator / antitoxin HipB